MSDRTIVVARRFRGPDTGRATTFPPRPGSVGTGTPSGHGTTTTT